MFAVESSASSIVAAVNAIAALESFHEQIMEHVKMNSPECILTAEDLENLYWDCAKDSPMQFTYVLKNSTNVRDLKSGTFNSFFDALHSSEIHDSGTDIAEVMKIPRVKMKKEHVETVLLYLQRNLKEPHGAPAYHCWKNNMLKKFVYDPLNTVYLELFEPAKFAAASSVQSLVQRTEKLTPSDSHSDCGNGGRKRKMDCDGVENCHTSATKKNDCDIFQMLLEADNSLEFLNECEFTARWTQPQACERSRIDEFEVAKSLLELCKT